MNKIIISKTKMLVKLNNIPVELPKRAFDLLYYFANHPNHMLSRPKIISEVWENSHRVPRVVDVAVRRIREKLGNSVIETHIHNGYKFVGDITIDDDVLFDTDNSVKIKDDIRINFPYENQNGDIVIVLNVAGSKYGKLVVYVANDIWNALPIKDFKIAFKPFKR